NAPPPAPEGRDSAAFAVTSTRAPFEGLAQRIADAARRRGSRRSAGAGQPCDPVAPELRGLGVLEAPPELGQHDALRGRLHPVEEDRLAGLTGHDVVVLVGRGLPRGHGWLADAERVRVRLGVREHEPRRSRFAVAVVAVLAVGLEIRANDGARVARRRVVPY